MRVLVAFEKSGIVRDAFIERGHDAMSCDLEPTERPGPHHQGDARPLMRERWDLVIAHPPCTALSTARGRPPDAELVAEGVLLFNAALHANSPRVAVENPQIYKLARETLGEPSQKIHPWQFGDAYLKRTWLWLIGLPPLTPMYSGIDRRIRLPSWVNSSSARKTNRVGLHRPGSKRSEFHPGVAAAMAKQWGGA